MHGGVTGKAGDSLPMSIVAMNTNYTLREDFPSPYSAGRELLRGPSSWKSRGAIAGLSGGLIAPIFAVLLTVISWFTDPMWHGLALHTAGTSLFVATLPLLVLGAHCLDLLDKENNLAQHK